MHTKRNGYFWCDKCDENAYGFRRQRCHSKARFVKQETESNVKRGREPVSGERGRQLFQEIYKMLDRN